jgi:hypothetical protein
LYFPHVLGLDYLQIQRRHNAMGDEVKVKNEGRVVELPLELHAQLVRYCGAETARQGKRVSQRAVVAQAIRTFLESHGAGQGVRS